MKTLELGYIHINDIIIGSESKIENGVLYVDEAAVKDAKTDAEREEKIAEILKLLEKLM